MVNLKRWKRRISYYQRFSRGRVIYSGLHNNIAAHTPWSKGHVNQIVQTAQGQTITRTWFKGRNRYLSNFNIQTLARPWSQSWRIQLCIMLHGSSHRMICRWGARCCHRGSIAPLMALLILRSIKIWLYIPCKRDFKINQVRKALKRRTPPQQATRASKVWQTSEKWRNNK